jgi:hypothetical protein
MVIYINKPMNKKFNNNNNKTKNFKRTLIKWYEEIITIELTSHEHPIERSYY